MAGSRPDSSPARWLAAVGLALTVAHPAAAQGRGSGAAHSGSRPYAGAAARQMGQLGGTSVPYPGTLNPPGTVRTGGYYGSSGYYGNGYPYNPCYPPCPGPGYGPYPVYSTFGLGYPGVYAGGNFGNFGFSVGLPATQQVVIDRRVYVLPAPAAESSGGQGNSDEGRRDNGARGERPMRPEGTPDRDSGAARGDGFYLTRPVAAEGLSDALKDLRRAWLNGDYLRLKDRFAGVTSVRLFPRGRYASAMGADDFAKMTRDALQAIETTAFELDPPTMSAPDRAFVTGKHTFTAPSPDGGPKRSTSVYISYTLELKDGLWRITEAGSGSEPISAHQR